VNLDTVDFAPILASLQCVAESARRLTEWEADGWIGSAGHELLSQLAKRWTAFESALVHAGMTENAAWTYDLEKSTAEQLNAAWSMLRDLLLDMRKGKYGLEGKFAHATLAKRLTLAAELVQGLTPKVRDEAPPLPSLTDEDSYILTVLQATGGKSLTQRRIMQESVRMECEDRTKVRRLSDSTIRTRVPVLLTHQLVARPPGTKKKGIAITDKGSQALAFGRANSTETQRKK
jgi:hypothetical protein